MYEELKKQAFEAAEELCERAGLHSGQILVVGCSTSEICGSMIGKNSSPEVAEAVFSGIRESVQKRGVWLAAQCCEHLNRAIVIEQDAVPGKDIVNAVPVPKAGGSFAAAAWNAFRNPVTVEDITADAGLDIGDTFIGMHLKKVVVPVRLGITSLGQAHLTAARVRPKYIGGSRTHYNESLL